MVSSPTTSLAFNGLACVIASTGLPITPPISLTDVSRTRAEVMEKKVSVVSVPRSSIDLIFFKSSALILISIIVDSTSFTTSPLTTVCVTELLGPAISVSALASTCLPSTGSLKVRFSIPLSRSSVTLVSSGEVMSCMKFST